MLSLLFVAAAFVLLLAVSLPRMAEGVPEAGVRPTRLVAPPTGRAQLEVLHHPLYSSVALATGTAIPRTIQFFTYARGQTVAGAGVGAVTATQFHTNLETPNFLSAPKTFTVEGVRLYVPMLAFAASPTVQDTVGVALAADPGFEDLIAIVNTCSFRFFVGPKDYVQCPLFALPSNTGLAGISATNISSTVAASVFQRRTAMHSTGPGFRLPSWPVLIANQQNFGAELQSQWTTNLSMQAGRLVYAILDGVLGREVQ